MVMVNHAEPHTPAPSSESLAKPPSLTAKALSVGYGERLVLQALSLSVATGKITALLGPNGSGKSTLLKTMARLLTPRSGAVLLDGAAIARLPTTQVARQLAVLPQAAAVPAGLTVHELVEQGRYPHAGPLRMLRRQDHHAISEALEFTDMAPFAGRPLEQLSGGERQRAWIALALAQQTPILLLDEPTTYLDMGHQLEVLTLMRRLNRERGLTIVLVLHDINQAARYAEELVVVKQGQVVAQGAPHEVVTVELLAQVFGVMAHILTDPESGTPLCVPYANVAR